MVHSVRKLLREPLVHFLLIGATLFAAYGALNKDAANSPEDIVITPGQIENLAYSFAKVWQRPPSTDELMGLINAHMKEEILSREAMKLGLDQDDSVIRQRLKQKMEFLAEDFAAASEPTEAELADYLKNNPDRFANEPEFTFRHVFLDPEKRGDRLPADAAALLAKLNKQGAAADASSAGDNLLLPWEFTDEPRHAVVAQFGEKFAAGLTKVNVGEWSGPIQSGYGTHLVYMVHRNERQLPALEEVRAEVKSELMNERRQEANLKFMNGLIEKYNVRIEWPVSAGATAKK